MRLVTVKDRPKLALNARHPDYAYRPTIESATFEGNGWRATYDVFKHGRRIAVGTLDIYWPEDGPEADVNFEAGPKTFRRIVELLLSETAGEVGVVSAHGEKLAWRQKGRHVIVQAPCGQVARVTKDELRRVLTGLDNLA